MNHILYLISLWGFLLLPAILLIFRLTKATPWWLLILLLCLLGWLFVNGAVHFYYESMTDQLHAYGAHPPAELQERWAADGAKSVFALLFGWAYALIYFLPWLLVYAAVRVLRR